MSIPNERGLMLQSDRPASDGASAEDVRRAAVVEVNSQIRALGDRLSHLADGDLQFWCECGDAHCHDCVFLSHQRYDELKRNGVPLVIAGHPIRQAREARDLAAELRAEAAAPTRTGRTSSKYSRRLGRFDQEQAT